VPDDGGSGSGFPKAGLESVGQQGAALCLGRNDASADLNACGPFFELTQRAGRIAPRP